MILKRLNSKLFSAHLLLYALTLSFCFNSNIFAAEPENIIEGGHVSNGGGLAEAHVAYTYLAFNKFVQICNASSECAANDDQRVFLKNLATVSTAERQSIRPVFKSEKQEPGFFIKDGIEQSYRTSTTANDPIYFNLDKIYKTEAAGVVTALPLQSIVDIVSQSFSAHFNVASNLDPAQIAVLFQKLGSVNWKNILSVDSLHTQFAPLMGAVMYVDRKAESGLTGFILSDYTNAYDYTKPLENSVRQVVQANQGDLISETKLQQGRWANLGFHGDYVDMSFVVKFQTNLTLKSNNQDAKPFICNATLVTRLDEEKNSHGNLRPYYLNPEQTVWQNVNCTPKG